MNIQELKVDGLHQNGSIGYLIRVSMAAAIGGLLFGYDTGVINGSLEFVVSKLALTDNMKGWMAASALLACIPGAFFAGALSDKIGRKKVLILAAVAFLISAVGTAFARNVTEFIIFRVIGGLGIGAASMTSPMYIAEISPARIRGRMVSVNQFAIVFGMLVVYFANFYIGGYGLAKDSTAVGGVMTKIAATDRVIDEKLAEQVVAELSLHDGYDDEDIAATFANNVLVKICLDEIRGYLAENKVKYCNPLARAVAAKYFMLYKQSELDIAEEIIRDKMAGEMPREDVAKLRADVSAMVELIVPKIRELDDIDEKIVEVRQIVSRISIDNIESWNVQSGWRWMFGSESLPAVILLFLMFFVPETPRWLAKQGRSSEALKILAHVDGTDYAKSELADIETTVSHESGSLNQLFHPGMRVVLVIGIVLAVLQQVTGINVFLYFGSEVFKDLGGERIEAALLQQVAVGVVNMLFTIIAIWTVDKIGRKPLLMIGAAGMGISLVAMGLAGMYEKTGMWILIFVLGYIAFFALSLGPVVWVVLSEIFPTKIRGRAMALATLFLWLSNSIVSYTFVMMDSNEWLIAKFNHGFPFFIYGGLCIVTILFVWRFVPETKGKSLEDIEKMWGAA